MTAWQLQDAQNRFSAVVEAALAGEPQAITRRGKPVVVMVAIEQYRQLCDNDAANPPSFVDYLLAIPKGSDDDGFELPSRTRDHSSRSVAF